MRAARCERLAELVEADAPPLPLRRADLLVTTAAHESWLRTAAAELRKPLIVIAVKNEGGMRALAPHYWEVKNGVRPASVW